MANQEQKLTLSDDKENRPRNENKTVENILRKISHEKNNSPEKIHQNSSLASQENISSERGQRNSTPECELGNIVDTDETKGYFSKCSNNHHDNYESFNYTAAEPKAVEIKNEISRKLMEELLKEEVRERQRLKGMRNHAERKREEVMAMRNRFPSKVPITVTRMIHEKTLPPLEKSKFLVPNDLTMGQFTAVLRTKMQLTKTKSLYLLIGDKSIVCPTQTMSEVYNNFASEDGFLYIQYASQETFG